MIFIAPFEGPKVLEHVIDEMNRTTQEWTMKAARGECSWICADCCCSFPKGMPDQCEYGHDSCTSIIKRDKANAVLA